MTDEQRRQRGWIGDPNRHLPCGEVLVHRGRNDINDPVRLTADRCVATPRATASSPSSSRLALDGDPHRLVDVISAAVH